MAKLDKMKYNIKEGHPFPMGVTREVDGINISVQAPEKMPVKFLVYKKLRYTGKEQPEKIPFPESGRMGKIICMKVEGLPESFAYHFQIGNEIETDSYAKYILGREQFGKNLGNRCCAFCFSNTYNWEGDRKPNIPMEDTILYRLHVRGFTKHASSQVNGKARGTFAGIKEKIPYLKELGITTVELLPAYEFDEVPKLSYEPSAKQGQSRINYWGYTDAYYFSPKASYSECGKAYIELKDLVKELHKNGIELCMEFYFIPGTRKEYIL